MLETFDEVDGESGKKKVFVFGKVLSHRKRIFRVCASAVHRVADWVDDMPASSRHALVDENGEEFIRPGCFSRCVVRCPCCITWLTFAIALGMAYVGFRGAKLEAAADAGYDTDTVPQQVSWYAWVKVYERRFFIPPVNVTTGGPSIDSKPIFFVYEALPGVDMNVFTPDAVERIAAFERTRTDRLPRALRQGNQPPWPG